MNAVLDSNCSSSSMKPTAVVASITFVDSLAPARLALSGLPPKARAVFTAVSPDRRWFLNKDSRRLATK
ncbi:MAG: hypothetical protein QE493_00045 [Verrucomicrobiae bacterium]|nr:hypothetical protein [Verrucomicrobiae bacterium]